jgi:regulator of sigma E protease
MIFTFIAAVIALSLSVLVHEFGHFVVGKLIGAKVLTFSVGFGPRMLGLRRGEADYRISWVPFGGYVKFAGMEDNENTENAFVDLAVWKRSLVMFAGPLFNLALAFIVFFAVIYTFGIGVINSTTVGEVYPGSPGAAAGIQVDDKLVSISGQEITDWDELDKVVQQSKGRPLSVRLVRGNEDLNVELVPAFNDTVKAWWLGLVPAIGTEAGEVMRDSPAYKAGLRPGDRIVSVDGRAVTKWDEMVGIIRASAGKKIVVEWLRDGTPMRAEVTPKAQMVASSSGEKVEKVGTIGILTALGRKKLSAAGSVAEGWLRTTYTLKRVVLFLVELFARKVSPSMIGGPAAIVQLAGESLRWGPEFFLGFFAFLSVNLFVLNLLPLPPLDGGQLAFLLFEGARRRPLSKTARLAFAQVGLLLLVLSMILVTFNDIMRLGTR